MILEELKIYKITKSFHPVIQIAVNGSTGPIHFDEDGFRNSFYMEVVQINPNESSRVLARYQCPSTNNTNCDTKNKKWDTTDNIEYFLNATSDEEIKISTIKGRTVKVIMKQSDPFLMVK